MQLGFISEHKVPKKEKDWSGFVFSSLTKLTRTLGNPRTCPGDCEGGCRQGQSVGASVLVESTPPFPVPPHSTLLPFAPCSQRLQLP